MGRMAALRNVRWSQLRRNPTSGYSATEHPTPPGPLYVLLSLSRSGVRLLVCLIGLLLDRLRRFSGLSEGLQLRLEGRGPLLCHLPADPFGSELLTNLSQFAHKWPYQFLHELHCLMAHKLLRSA